jgi:hypothetical protein
MLQRPPPQYPQRFPDVHSMRTDDALHPRRRYAHRLHHGPKISVRGQHHDCFAPSRLQCRHRELPLGVVVPREHEFAPSDRHLVQPRRIIQAEQAAVQAPAGGEFRQHRRQVAACSLYPAGSVQFREEANDHGPSLPSAAPNGKSRCSAVSQTAAPMLGFRVSQDRGIVAGCFKSHKPSGLEGL